MERILLLSRGWMLVMITHILLVASCLSVEARSLHIRTKDGKVGMVDEQGNVVIPIEFTMVEPWGQFYRVEKGHKKYGLYNDRGQIVLPVEYKILTRLNCYGRALIGDGGTYVGVAVNINPDLKDSKTKPTEWFDSTDLTEMLFNKERGKGGMFIRDAKYGIIDSNARFLVPCQYKGLYEFSNDVSSVAAYGDGLCLEADFDVKMADKTQLYAKHCHFPTDTLKTDCRYLGFSVKRQFKTEKAGILDGQTGKVLVPEDKYNIVFKPVNGMARWYTGGKSGFTYGYVNVDTGKDFEVGKSSEKIAGIKWITHSDFYGDIAAVGGDVWHFVNRDGQTVGETYQSANHGMITHMWTAHKADGTIVVMDDNGSEKPGFQGFSEVLLPENKDNLVVFPVKGKNGQWGLLAADGTELSPCIYEAISIGCCDVVGVKNDVGWGLLNSQGSQVLPCRYVQLTMPVENDAAYVWAKKDDSLWYKVNVYSGKEGETGYVSVEPFKNGMAWVRPLDIKGQAGLLGNVLLDKKIIAGTDEEKAKKVNKKNNDDEYVSPVDMSGDPDWGIIINEQGETVFPEAINRRYAPEAKRAVMEKGGVLSVADAHNLLLHLSVSKREYPMNIKIDEDEWDY